MTITIDRHNAEKLEIEISNVSVIFDSIRNILVIHGMLFPKKTYSFDDKSLEPDILCTFYDRYGNVIHSTPTKKLIPFNLNQYGVFSLELSSERIDVDGISEIRLLPFLSKNKEWQYLVVTDYKTNTYYKSILR